MFQNKIKEEKIENSNNLAQKNYFDMVTRKINGMKNVQELKKRLQKSNKEKRWMKLLDDIDDDFSLLFRLNSKMLADKYQLFVEEYQKHKKRVIVQIDEKW